MARDQDNEIQEVINTGSGTELPMVIEDGAGNGHLAEVLVRGDGRKAVATDTTISSVNVPQGRYPLPMTWIRVENTGAQSSQWDLFVRGTSADPTSPDRDVADYNKSFVVSASEDGDEELFVQNVVNTLNADNAFQNAFLKAVKVRDRAIFVIRSSKFSTIGDFWNRTTASSVTFSNNGAGTAFIKWDTLESRPLETTLDIDPNNPHALGQLGITGSVSVTPGPIQDRLILFGIDGASSNLLVDGSVTPVDFMIDADANQDIFVEKMIFSWAANGIKSGQFFSVSTLTNGIEIFIRSEGELIDLFQTPLIQFKETDDFQDIWGEGLNSNVILRPQAGRDTFTAVFELDNPFKIAKAGTVGATDDEILVRVQDNLTAASLKKGTFHITGFYKDV